MSLASIKTYRVFCLITNFDLLDTNNKKQISISKNKIHNIVQFIIVLLLLLLEKKIKYRT